MEAKCIVRTRDVQKVRAKKSANDHLFYYYRNVHVHKIHYETHGLHQQLG